VFDENDVSRDGSPGQGHLARVVRVVLGTGGAESERAQSG